MVGGSFNALFLGLGLTTLFHPCVARYVRDPGYINLHMDVFDKIVSKHEVVLVKFAGTIPFSPTKEEFAKVAQMSITQPDLLVAEVQVSEYDSDLNQDLAKRFNVKKKDWPAYRLFRKGQEKPVVYKGNPDNAEEVIKFVIDNAGVWLGFPGCLEHFDKLVLEFMDTKGDDRKAVIGKAEEAAKSLTKKEDKESADVYIKTMKTIVKKGKSYIKRERKRVEDLKEEGSSEKNKNFLSKRIGILSSFNLRIKDEL